MYAKPKERITSERDDVLTVPLMHEDMTYGGVTVLLYSHRPRFVADRFIRDGIGPKCISADVNRGLKVGEFRIAQCSIETFSLP